MSKRLRVEIKSRDEFWQKAVLIEWEYRHPDWKLTGDDTGFYLIDAEWLESLKAVATECNSTINVGPRNPGRRSMFQKLIPSFDRDSFNTLICLGTSLVFIRVISWIAFVAA